MVEKLISFTVLFKYINYKLACEKSTFMYTCRVILYFFDWQVSLWKETLEGQWVCVSDVNKGQGQVKDTHQSEMIMS